MITVNDLFCGAGGMGLGFKNAGFIIQGAWDFDKYAVESYRHNVGDHVKQMDITKMVASDIPYADVWTFGFPCQDISIAGKQAGMVQGETRSGLFYEVMRLLDEVEQKPKIILAENVKGVKKYLPTIEEEYDKAGYKMYYTLYNSKYWGVPQNRERYFMLGVRKDLNKVFEFPKQQTDFVPKLSSILDTEVDEKYYLNKPFAFENRPNSNIIGMVEMKGNETVRRIYDTEQVGPTLTTSEGGHRQPKILEDVRVRKLTPREYARLQGFDDSFEFVVSNTQLYKQFGNAVTVNVAEAIANQIKEFLR